MSETLSVNDLVSQIKSCVETQFEWVRVMGEITNLSKSSAGHFYLNLSDANASISCALFRLDAFRNPLIHKLKNGDKVTVSGPVEIYKRRGTFQIIIKQVMISGKGDLKEQFEQLKKKLSDEGLFDIEHKKKIPSYPRRIGLITAETGAALQDFIKISKRKSLWMNILLANALVQGDAAPKSLRAALALLIKYHRQAPRHKQLDVIVLTRGGGSLEDLWAFNDEGLVRDVFACPLPIISAVGHEVDYMLTDMVADLRCETPSAAAETLCNEQSRLKERFTHLGTNLTQKTKELIYKSRHQLSSHHPQAMLGILKTCVYNREKRLEKNKLTAERFLDIINHHEHLLRLEDINRKLSIIPAKTEKLSWQLDKFINTLNALNPDNVLKRGYAYMQDDKARVVGSKKALSKISPDTPLSVKFFDGKAMVKRI